MIGRRALKAGEIAQAPGGFSRYILCSTSEFPVQKAKVGGEREGHSNR